MWNKLIKDQATKTRARTRLEGWSIQIFQICELLGFCVDVIRKCFDKCFMKWFACLCGFEYDVLSKFLECFDCWCHMDFLKMTSLIYDGLEMLWIIRDYPMHAWHLNTWREECFTWKLDFWHALVGGPCVALGAMPICVIMIMAPMVDWGRVA